MLTKREAILVALLVTAFWAIVFVLTSDAAVPYEICEPAKEGAKQAAKECARYNIISFAFREVGAHLDLVSALITAVATSFIARYTFTLKRSTDNLWKAGTDQLVLSTEEFRATHRPKIIVHAVDVKRFPDATNPQASEIDKIGAVLLCVNKGRGEAIKVEIRGTTMVSSSVPDAKIMRPIIKTVDSLERGIKIWVEINTERASQELRVSPQPIYFIGTISYFDKNENRRETGFCFMFHPPVGDWMRIEAKTHDYAY